MYMRESKKKSKKTAGVPFSRASSGPRDQTWVSPGRQILYLLRHQGSTSVEFVQDDETERKKEAYK